MPSFCSTILMRPVSERRAKEVIKSIGGDVLESCIKLGPDESILKKIAFYLVVLIEWIIFFFMSFSAAGSLGNVVAMLYRAEQKCSYFSENVCIKDEECLDQANLINLYIAFGFFLFDLSLELFLSLEKNYKNAYSALIDSYREILGMLSFTLQSFMALFLLFGVETISELGFILFEAIPAALVAILCNSLARKKIGAWIEKYLCCQVNPPINPELAEARPANFYSRFIFTVALLFDAIFAGIKGLGSGRQFIANITDLFSIDSICKANESPWRLLRLIAAGVIGLLEIFRTCREAFKPQQNRFFQAPRQETNCIEKIFNLKNFDVFTVLYFSLTFFILIFREFFTLASEENPKTFLALSALFAISSFINVSLFYSYRSQATQEENQQTLLVAAEEQADLNPPQLALG